MRRGRRQTPFSQMQERWLEERLERLRKNILRQQNCCDDQKEFTQMPPSDNKWYETVKRLEEETLARLGKPTLAAPIIPLEMFSKGSEVKENR